MIFRNQGSLIKKSNSISKDELIDLYGLNSYEFTQTTKEEIFVCSKNKDLDRLVGFARCTGDGILEATVWDVAINPVYQGLGLGKELMKYVLKELKNIGISKVTLFADAEVVSFYKRQGWILEPRGSKCAFWYAN